MADLSFHTTQLKAWVDRVRAGDAAAKDELLRATYDRMIALSRKMLKRFPGVARWDDTADVYQESAMRLLRTLADVTPTDTRGFANLAATCIRRQLLDLARRYAGPHGLGTRHAEIGHDGPPPDAKTHDPDLDRWVAFHEAVETLPVEDREVFGLTFYHGWSQADIAALFGVDERTVRRRFRSAGLALAQALGGELPDGE